jgi:hypothetical protein
MTMQPIKKIIPSFIRSHGFGDQLQAQQVVELSASVLRGLWDEERASYVIPISFQKGKLKCEANSSSALQQLTVDQTKFLNEINRRLNGQFVKSLHVVRKGF